MIIFATGWTIIVGLVILSYKSNANGSRLNDEKKVCRDLEPENPSHRANKQN